MIEMETGCWNRIYLANDVWKTFSSSVDVNAPKLARAGVESGTGVHELQMNEHGSSTKTCSLGELAEESRNTDLIVVGDHVVTRLPSLLEAEATVI